MHSFYSFFCQWYTIMSSLFFTVKLVNAHKQKIQQNTAEILRNKQLITVSVAGYKFF